MTRRHVRAPPARLRGLYHYPRSWLRGDLLAGVTVAAYQRWAAAHHQRPGEGPETQAADQPSPPATS